MLSEALIAAAFVDACRSELEAPKPGNIHVFADGHGATVRDFLLSARAASGPLARAGASLGVRILGAVEATAQTVGRNTNLGIILLCAPIAMAAELPGVPLVLGVERVVLESDMADARDAFAAIALANPGGLGHAHAHDVRDAPTVTLAEAMRAAADRDMIARQYANGFADIFTEGLAEHVAAQQRWGFSYWATEALYLHFLGRFPDSHVVRYYGEAVAAGVQVEARAWQIRLMEAETPETLLPELLAWDTELKRHGINPGTSADLTVATIFAASLQAVLP